MYLFLIALITSNMAKAEFNYGRTSDITLAASVVGSIAAMPTWKKRGVAAVTHVGSAGINYGLKRAFAAWGPASLTARPDDPEDLQGFPSGHSQAAMTGAGIVCQEYGGLPCAAGVSLGITTMAGRVLARRHSIQQVTVGGLLGFSSGFWGITLSGGF